jgi:hypothetical protein
MIIFYYVLIVQKWAEYSIPYLLERCVAVIRAGYNLSKTHQPNIHTHEWHCGDTHISTVFVNSRIAVLWNWLETDYLSPLSLSLRCLSIILLQPIQAARARLALYGLTIAPACQQRYKDWKRCRENLPTHSDGHNKILVVQLWPHMVLWTRWTRNLHLHLNKILPWIIKYYIMIIWICTDCFMSECTGTW